MNKMAKDLMGLELECYGQFLGKEETNDNRMERSSKARHDLTRTAHQRQEEVRTHIVSQNTACAGLITWMKRGVTYDVNPSPINFKEALSYLMERETYESTGSEVLDFYGFDVDKQYDIIMKILHNPSSSGQEEEPKTR